MERGKFIVAVVKNSFFLIIYMKQKEINSICLFMSFTALIFVLCLYFKSSREGLENEEKKPDEEKTDEEISDEVKMGENWQLKPTMPSADVIKEMQKSGQKIDKDNIEKNLTLMFKNANGDWVPKFVFNTNGILEGKEFKKLELKK
jgi:hypothetical protein